MQPLKIGLWSQREISSCQVSTFKCELFVLQRVKIPVLEALLEVSFFFTVELGSTLPGHVDSVPILYCKNHIQIGPKKGIFPTIMGMGFFDHQSHGRVLILRRKAF